MMYSTSTSEIEVAEETDDSGFKILHKCFTWQNIGVQVPPRSAVQNFETENEKNDLPYCNGFVF